MCEAVLPRDCSRTVQSMRTRTSVHLSWSSGQQWWKNCVRRRERNMDK